MLPNKKLLIVPMVGGRGLGPIYRSLSLAEVAKKKFDIKFLCNERFMPLVEKQGFSGWIDVEPSSRGQQGHIIKWDDAAYTMGLCECNFVEKAFLHQLKIVSDYKPDVIFTEYNLTILLVALILNIPIVSTVNWADAPDFELPELDCSIKHIGAINPYNKILHRYNCGVVYKSISEFVTSVPRLVAPTIYDLQPELDKYGVLYIGELLNRFVEETSDDEHFEDGNIYVYLTSSDIETEQWLRVVIRELKAIGRLVYVVSNDSVFDSLKTYNEIELCGFEFRNSFPSLSVMKSSGVVVHSGSANIISGSLLYGVPSVMIPLSDGERLYNSKNVSRNNCGCLDSESEFFTEGFLRKTIDEIFCSDMNLSAKLIGEKIRNAGGPVALVNLLMALSH